MMERLCLALLPTILHHTPEPDDIIKESARIAKRLIIIEDVYEGRFDIRIVTALMRNGDQVLLIWD